MIEFSKKQYWGTVLMFITINLLFYYRYLDRISSPVAWSGTLFYLILVIYLFCKDGFSFLSKIPVKIVWIFILTFLAGSAWVLQYIPVEMLKVDRWEVIHVFWDSVKNSINPYGVPNSVGNYPGPMPVYFLLYYPFYAIGEIGYSLLIALLLWLCFFSRAYSKSALIMVSVLLFSSAFLFWELFTRSTVLINACLFCYYFLYLLRSPATTGRRFWMTAIIGGLVFSIRNVFVLPMIIWVVYMIHTRQISFFKLIIWGGLFALTFGMTFVPFLILWPDEFLRINPFLIQSSVLIPFQYVIVCMILSVCLGFLASSKGDVFFYSALILFAMITVHVAYWIIREGITVGYFNGRGDISYYMFAVPFLLEIMVQRSNQLHHDKE